MLRQAPAGEPTHKPLTAPKFPADRGQATACKGLAVWGSNAYSGERASDGPGARRRASAVVVGGDGSHTRLAISVTLAGYSTNGGQPT